MHPTLLKAVQKAQEHIGSFSNPAQNAEKELRKELKLLKKDELIERIVAETLGNAAKPKISTLVYAILEDPDCAWLTWDTMAALITSSVEGSKTTASSLQWYPSQGAKEGRDIIPRKPTKEIAALLTEALTNGGV